MSTPDINAGLAIDEPADHYVRPQMYDITIDMYRDVTQQDVDQMTAQGAVLGFLVTRLRALHADTMSVAQGKLTFADVQARWPSVPLPTE